MKKVIFRFPIALMNRLTYSRKMLVVAVVFLIPIVIATYQLINLLQTNIALTQNELKGNAYLGPTLALLQHVQQHRGATATFLSGDESFGAVMQQKQAAIAEDLRAVDEVDQQYGAEFGLQSEWAALRQEWLDLQGAAAGLTRADSFARHTELIRKILDYRIAIADATALSLDPEADTYHLMMAVVQEIPDASEFLGQSRATGSAAVADGSLNEEERLKLQSLAVLAQWRITGARRSTQSVIEANPSLSERLAGPMDQAEAQGQSFLELLDAQVINAESVTITSVEYFDAATVAIDAQFALVNALSEALSERLTARAERLAQQRLLALSVAVLPVLLAVWLFAGFYFSAIEALQRTLRAAAGIAEGDLNQHIEIQSRDEVGQMAQTFSRMIDYLNGMAGVATQISEGDLTAHVQPRSERDVLGNVFVHMLTNLRRLIGQAATNASSVGVASHQLATTADQAGRATAQIATTVQQVASGVAQQTEHVSRTANSMEQMRRAIEGVAKGAQEQSQAVAQASGVVGQLSSAVEGIRHGAEAQAEGAQRAEQVQALLAQSLTQVREVTGQVAAQSAQAAATAVDGAQLAEANVGGIRRVYATTEQLAQRVRDLGKRSGQIGSIVETIDDIAAQTNLLALNAAIEAARAGEHGKGFAVVADEVRKLAERAASATKEITEMIRLIQSGANEVSETMQTAGDEVSKSVQLTEEAGAAFQTIATSARGVSDQIQAAQSAIAAMQAANEKLEQVVTDVKQVAERNRLSAQDMAALNTRVVESLDEVSAVVEENTAATEQMAASATEVTHAVENIASVSEENSAAAEQVSASTEEMSAQVAEVTTSAQSLAEMAQALQEFVGQFKLSEMDTTALTANVETFKQAHLNWLKRAKTMMAGGATFTVADVPAHTDCAFGRWYCGRAAHEFGSLPEYTALDAPHRDFHAHLKALVGAHAQGQRNKAAEVLRRLEAASTEVVIGLTALEQAITRKPATRRAAGSESVRSREAVLS